MILHQGSNIVTFVVRKEAICCGLRTVPTVSSPSVSVWQSVIEPEDQRQMPSGMALVDRQHFQKGDLPIDW